MKNLRYQSLLVFGLAVLLFILGFYQYKWVGQISEAEQERLQNRLEIDAKHFADDFDRIIQNAYFTFQISGQDWQNVFLAQYDLWQRKALYPQLIKSFEVVLPTDEVTRFDFRKRTFTETAEFKDFFQLQSNFQPIDEAKLKLRMPIYQDPELPIPSQIQTPNIFGILEIELDEEVIKNQIVSNLKKKYFSDGSYKLAFKSRLSNKPLFGTEMFEDYDVSVGIFELMPDNAVFVINRNLLTTLSQNESNGQFIFDQGLEDSPDAKMEIKIFGTNQGSIFKGASIGDKGRWALNIQHEDGSLEKFVANSRQRNLMISFGILGLLAVSSGFIFLSAHRAQTLAQRQIEFVSAVSHEFRTPIAVIYSAGENLADGVARDGSQVSRYGALIKGEGKKLAAMVEQILEFAGAKSGQKKYDFREVDLKDLVESAVRDCQPFIQENSFEIETDFSENLGKVRADFGALSRAIQNLVINGVKYSPENKRLKISLRRENEAVKIVVEDKGIGIDKKDLRQIFSPFFRAKAVVDAQIHGNGLGLSLVKQTVEAHNGKIEVESKIGRGSKFTIELPQARND